MDTVNLFMMKKAICYMTVRKRMKTFGSVKQDILDSDN